MKKAIFGTIFVTMFTTASWGIDATKFQIPSFSIEPVAAIQANGSVFSSFLNFTPRYAFDDKLYARLNLGFSIFKNRETVSSRFLVMDMALLGGYFFTPNIGAEIGAGFQSFFGGGGTSLALTGNLVYRLSNKLLVVIDRFTVGYTAVLLSNAVTHEIRLGVGISF